jgi:hypothetical protein
MKLTLKKRLLLSNDDKPEKKTQKEPKLAVYDIDWFDSTSKKNECLKHTSTNNVPSTQEEQLTFLLSKYQASDIKTAFADAIGKARLVIPVFQEFIFGAQKQKKTGFLRISFFSCVFRRNF